MAKNSFYNPVDFPDEDQENMMTDHHDCHANMMASTNMHELPVEAFQFQGFPSLSSVGFAEDISASSSRSHRQAEKRRRDRINAQLARLRKLIPKSDKMDKAALLERVVDQVRDLKRKASEISKFLTIPTENDDITVECHTNIPGFKISHENASKNMLIKATVCCEDRPNLITEFIRELRGFNLTTIRADIACLGGRMKSILILYSKDISDVDHNGGDVCNVSSIKNSLMALLNRMVSCSPNVRITSKRQQVFFSP